MKESEIQQAFDEYKLALADCSRRTVVARAKNAWPARLVFGTAAVTALTGLLLLSPRRAEAGALTRIAKAVHDAKSIEIESYAQRRSGKWVEFHHSYLQGSLWKADVFTNSPLSVHYVVSGGMDLTEYAHLDHATLEPVDRQFFNEAQPSDDDPLSFVEGNIDMGQAGRPRQTTTHPHEPVNGRPTYAITLDRKSDLYHAEVLVDKETDLPFEANVSVLGPRDQGVLRYRMQYRFNQNWPESFFSLTSTKPVINLPVAQAKLTKAWEKPLVDAGTSQIRDICRCPDGTIWIVSTTDLKQSHILPTRLMAAGQPYARIDQDLVPSAILAKSSHYRFHGEEVYITGFVPTEPLTDATVTQASISLQRRNSDLPGYGIMSKPSDKMYSPLTVVQLPVRRESSRYPSYFPALDLDQFSFQVPILITETRAEYFAKHDQFVAAAKAYEDCAVAYRGFVKYVGYEPLLKAADCYRKANRPTDAARVTEEAQELKAARER